HDATLCMWCAPLVIPRRSARLACGAGVAMPVILAISDPRKYGRSEPNLALGSLTLADSARPLPVRSGHLDSAAWISGESDTIHPGAACAARRTGVPLLTPTLMNRCSSTTNNLPGRVASERGEEIRRDVQDRLVRRPDGAVDFHRHPDRHHGARRQSPDGAHL